MRTPHGQVQRVLPRGRRHEMDVIGHQAVSQRPHPVLLALLTQEPQVRETVSTHKGHTRDCPRCVIWCGNPGMTTRACLGMPTECLNWKEQSLHMGLFIISAVRPQYRQLSIQNQLNI